MRKISTFFIALIIILSLIPLLWSSGLELDIAELTAEWYKSIATLISAFLGFLFFDYLLKRNKTNKLIGILNIYELQISSYINEMKSLKVNDPKFIENLNNINNLIRSIKEGNFSDIFSQRLSTVINVYNKYNPFLEFILKNNKDVDKDILSKANENVLAFLDEVYEAYTT